MRGGEAEKGGGQWRMERQRVLPRANVKENSRWVDCKTRQLERHVILPTLCMNRRY